MSHSEHTGIVTRLVDACKDRWYVFLSSCASEIGISTKLSL